MSKENHAKAPLCAAFVERLRAQFGAENVKVEWVEEGDLSLGEKAELDWVQATWIVVEK